MAGYMGVPIGNIGAMTGANFAPLQQDIQRQTQFQSMLAELNARQQQQMQAQEFSAKQDWLGQQFAKGQQHEQSKERLVMQQNAAKLDHERSKEEQQVRERAIAAEMAQMQAEHKFKMEQAAADREIAQQQFGADQTRKKDEFAAELAAQGNYRYMQDKLERDKMGMGTKAPPPRVVQWQAKLSSNVRKAEDSLGLLRVGMADLEDDLAAAKKDAESDDDKVRAAGVAGMNALRPKIAQKRLDIASMESIKRAALAEAAEGPPPEVLAGPEPAPADAPAPTFGPAQFHGQPSGQPGPAPVADFGPSAPVAQLDKSNQVFQPPALNPDTFTNGPAELPAPSFARATYRRPQRPPMPELPSAPVPPTNRPFAYPSDPKPTLADRARRFAQVGYPGDSAPLVERSRWFQSVGFPGAHASLIDRSRWAMRLIELGLTIEDAQLLLRMTTGGDQRVEELEQSKREFNEAMQGNTRPWG